MNNIMAMTTKDFQSPRDFYALPPKIQAYFLELECFIAIKQLSELNMSPTQAIELVAATLMKHDMYNAVNLADSLSLTASKFSNKATFKRALARYLWTGGFGIMHCRKISMLSQSDIYKVLSSFQDDIDNDHLQTNLEQYLCEDFIKHVDSMSGILNSFNGSNIRKQNGVDMSVHSIIIKGSKKQRGRDW